jgi:ribonuclease HII
MSANTTTSLATSYEGVSDTTILVGIDEAGRGPLFGRVYAAATILPKDDFPHDQMKDSKRFHSKRKLRAVAQTIRDHPGVLYAIHFVEPDIIDRINIRQAVFRAMHDAIRDVVAQAKTRTTNNLLLLVDGNDFTPHMHMDMSSDEHVLTQIPHVTVESGDNRYTCIAASSILAKVAHDDYIASLCAEHPTLVEHYALDKNVGYGTRAHLDGISKHGITPWHRKSFARCKDANDVSTSSSS